MMESLNLHTLVNSLPSAQHNTEELTNNFRAAALSITTLYRSSRKHSKRAYNAGYASACQDLLSMIQQGVSDSDAASKSGEHQQGLTIGRVMDWVEARLEAVKAREEEEDEEEEREGGKLRPTTGTTATTASAGQKVESNPKKTPGKSKMQPAPLPTPTSPHPQLHPHASSPSSSPPPSHSQSSLRPIPIPIQRLRPRGKVDLPGDLNLLNDGSIPSTSHPPIPISAGAKRRHAMMMMLDGPSAAVDCPASPPMCMGSNNGNPGGGAQGGGGGANAGSGSSRRRMRNSHSRYPQNQNQALAGGDGMDVEEEGRERKRVARR